MPTLKFGLKEAQNKAAIQLGDILTGFIPPLPLEVFHLDLPDWQMLGNDHWSDCAAVTWADVRRIMTRLGGSERYPSLHEVLELYKTQNPGFDPDAPGSQDDGMYLQQLLEYLHKTPGPDGQKVVAFARVNPRSFAEINAAISIFGYVWTGVAIRRQVMKDFYARRPWDYYPQSPIDGYHSLLVGGYDSDQVGANRKCKTWGTVTGFTDAFWEHDATECYVAIWPEHLGARAFQEGVDLQALQSVYRDITGRDLELPDVPPEPTDPTVNPLDAEFATAFKRWRGSRRSWSGKTAAGQLVKTGNDWLNEKGLED